MTPGHLDDAMLIWFPGVFKSRKSPFTNTYKLYTKLFAFLHDVHAKTRCLLFPKGEYLLAFHNTLHYAYNVFKANAPWFNFMFFKHSNKEHVFLKENSNNPEDEYVYPISKKIRVSHEMMSNKYLFSRMHHAKQVVRRTFRIERR